MVSGGGSDVGGGGSICLNSDGKSGQWGVAGGGAAGWGSAGTRRGKCMLVGKGGG